MANKRFLSSAFTLSGWGAAAVAAWGLTPAAAQEGPPPAAPVVVEAPFRKIVPGVERGIDGERNYNELTSLHDVVELDYPWAKTASFRHDVWALEFTFKPIRFVKLDLPGEDGKLRRKTIWYMVYRVKNPGVVYRAKPTLYAAVDDDEVKSKALGGLDIDWKKKDIASGEVMADENGEPVRFVPTFLFYSRDTGKAYLDRVLPTAEAVVRRREDPARKLLNSVQITGDIPASGKDDDKSVWGYVTWEDVDPRTDFFSIYIQGLTNAYTWKDMPDGSKWYARKTLRLDFWRPSDEFIEDEQAIRYLRSTWVFLDADWRSKPPEPKQ